MARPAVVLVGPQRHHPSVVGVIRALGLSGPLGLVTAGWQRRESEEHELREAVGGEWVNLRLYQRYEEVRDKDTELREILAERQEKLRALQGLYRLRLSNAVTAAATCGVPRRMSWAALPTTCTGTAGNPANPSPPGGIFEIGE